MLRDKLSQRSGISEARLEFIQNNASKMYKTYDIPKRNGNKREISQPTPELKAIQRWISIGIFQRLPQHESATAYKKGASIRKNASAHVDTSFTLHLDFKNFFPSFTRQNIQTFLKSKTKFTDKDINFCASLLCKDGRLTIGAPSSPAVTNAMMFDFDCSLTDWCQAKELVYTRYADDINISAIRPDSLSDIKSYAQDILRNYPYVKLELNEEKTAFLSRKYRRSVTGLILTPEGNLSIGRERKRAIKAMVHQFINNSLDADNQWRLGGLVAFANDVEPQFLNSLELKYGKEVVERILHQKTPTFHRRNTDVIPT